MVLNRQDKVRVELAPLKTFLQQAKTAAGIPRAKVTVCLVSDREMSRLNQTYRRKHGPTDVLSFPERVVATNVRRGTAASVPAPHERKSELTGRSLGDIAIAPETARRYAQRTGRSLRDEMRVLILHGVLHLMGYDHETDHGEMDRKELQLRRRLGLAP